ncbi:unnamed protein product [Adineta ricciae]|uniref:SH3 domain-containing protein n=1 Tax=Adineta ricciae TaxID=249248 RepID=A0A814KH20_ADIRI|nr:unnamed protein product [Adineta ricciae]
MQIVFHLKKKQDSSTLSFTSSSRNQIKKAMSDRSSTFSEMSITSTANKPAEIPQKKTSLSFNLFDSILSRTTTKPQSIRATKKKSPTYLSSSSCPQTSMEIPEQVRCLCNYNAIKDDEICVHKGDYVQILTTSQDNRWFVRHRIHRTTSSIQGWVPGFVLGRQNSNTSTNLSASTLPSSSRSANSLNQV